MFRLLNSHLQAYSLQVKSQDDVHTLGSHCVYISEILKPDHLSRKVNVRNALPLHISRVYFPRQMTWLKYFTDVNTMRSQCVHSNL